MRKINLFYLIDGGNSWGGAESNLLSVVKHINKERYNVELGCLVGGRVADLLRSSGLPVTVVGLSKGRDISAVVRLARLLRNKKVDILHTCLYASNTYGRVAAVLARTPVSINWEQNVARLKPQRHVWMDRVLNKFTDAIVAISEAVKGSVVEVEKIGGAKIIVVYNCVEVASSNPSFNGAAKRAELGLRPEDRVLPYIASLGPRKGHKYFLPAIKEVVKIFPEVKFLFVGEGPFGNEIERDIERLDIRENVLLCGFRRDIHEILGIAEFYVHPAIVEALGVAILEAMASGKAVVANRVDGVPEVVAEGETGLLVPPKDTEAMARAIIELLKSPSRTKEMGERGRERAIRCFSAENSAMRLERVYEPFILTKVLRKDELEDEEVHRIRSHWMKDFYMHHTERREEWFSSSPLLTYNDRVRRKALLELLRPANGEKILEVGCGDGTDLHLFSKMGAGCVGIDYGYRIVSVAKEKLAKGNNAPTFAVADATSLPLKDCSFEKVYCSEVLEHIPEYQKALEEIARVLKPGGKAVFTVPNRHSLKGIIKGYHSLVDKIFNRCCNPHPYDEWKTRKELKIALMESGLEVQEEIGVDFMPWFFNPPRLFVRVVGFLEERTFRGLPGWGNTLAVSAVKGCAEESKKVLIVKNA